jgi:AcrR family transcriptional regulator
MPDHRPRPPKAALFTGISAGRARPDQIRGGNHGLTREQVATSQRERVLAAMRDLVGGRGYQSVPVTEVIRHAGVSRKTFYELYSGKEECFSDVYEREMERLLAPALHAFEGDEPWVDRLRTALGVLLGSLAADRDGARICFVEVLAAGSLALERRNVAMAALDPLLSPEPSGGSPSDDPAGRPGPATAGAVGYLSETLQREIAAGRTAQLPSLRSELVRTLARPFSDPSDQTAPVSEERTVHEAADDPSERAFVAAYGAIAADVLGRVSAAMATDDAPAERVRAGIAALLRFCAEEPNRARACFVEALSAGPGARERRAETSRRLSDLFVQPLRELRPSDRIAEVSAIALVGGFQELAYDAVDRRVPARLPTVDAVVAAARLEPPA